MSKLVDENKLQVYRMVVGPFDNNSYLITDTQQSRCVVIDAAADADRILNAIGSHQVVAILQTHTHMDHTQALREVRERTGAPVGIHPLEPEAAELGPEISLADGQRIAVGSHELQVLHTPGHTPGSLCFLLRPALCFCGDTIFPGGPGKTWSPDAFHQLTQSLEQKIYTLVDRVRLLPGHGEEIAVGESRREYEAFKSRPLKETPWGDVLWEEP
jgi:glyoxylase-like metal-dependent hydrolase (beta-lactamase superfamily II)